MTGHLHQQYRRQRVGPTPPAPRKAWRCACACDQFPRPLSATVWPGASNSQRNTGRCHYRLV